RERYFRPPPEARMESLTEPSKQRELRPIPDRIARRVGSKAKVEPDGGEPGAKGRNRNASDIALFDPAQLLVRRTGRVRAGSKAQPGGDSSESMLLTDLAEVARKPPSTAIGR